MAAKVTGKLWEMSDMVKVLEDWEAIGKLMSGIIYVLTNAATPSAVTMPGGKLQRLLIYANFAWSTYCR